MNVLRRSTPGERTATSNIFLNQTLASETELQKLLADEKLRGEQHRVNYQAVKQQLEKASEECRKQKLEIEEQKSEVSLLKQHYKQSIDKLELELRQRNEIIHQLDQHSVTPEKVEAIKIKVLHDLQNSFRQRMTEMEEEVHKYRTDFNKVRHDFTFLKSEFDKQAEFHSSETLSIIAKHKTELASLLGEKEDWLAQYNKDRELDHSKMKNLIKENAQLTQRLKSERSQVRELQSQLEKLDNDHQSLSKNQQKLLTDHLARIKILELDKNSLQNQIESISVELKNNNDKYGVLSVKLNAAEKENCILLSQLENKTHELVVRESELKINHAKIHNASAQKLSDLDNKLQDTITELEIMSSQCEKYKNLITSRDKENTKRLERQKESHAIELNEMRCEKANMESTISGLSTQIVDLEKQLKESSHKITNFTSDLEALKSSFAQNTLLLDDSKILNNDLKAEICKKSEEINSLTKTGELCQQREDSLRLEFDETKRENARLNSVVSENSDRLKTLEIQLNNVKQSEKAQFQESLREWFSEKTLLTSNVDKLSIENENLRRKLTKAAKIHLSKKTSLRNRIAQYRERLDELTTKLKSLETAREHERGVPVEIFNRLRREFRVLNRKHAQFQELLNTKNSMTNVSREVFEPSGISSPTNIIPDKTYHWNDIEEVKIRMEKLSREQCDLQKLMHGCSIEKPVGEFNDIQHEQDWNPEDDSVGFHGWHSVDNKVLFDLDIDNLQGSASFDKDSNRASKLENRETHRSNADRKLTHRSNAEIVSHGHAAGGDSTPTQFERLAAEHFINTELESAKVIGFENDSGSGSDEALDPSSNS